MMNHISYPTEISPDFMELGNAAAREQQRIFAKVMMPSSRAFFKNIPLKKRVKGLNIFCGEGEITQELLWFLRAGSSILSFDPDPTSIKIAKEKFKTLDQQLEFQLLKNSNCFQADAYDFIYCQNFHSQVEASVPWFQKMRSSLKPDGFVLIEHFELSHFQCFPHNYAFDRYIDLRTALDQQKSTRPISRKQLVTLLYQAQFQKLNIQQVPPAFLAADCKQIASLSLEAIGSQLIRQKLLSSAELQALLLELKAFENQQNTMISFPSIYQILAYK